MFDSENSLSWRTFFLAVGAFYGGLLVFWLSWNLANAWVAGAIVDALREVVL